MNARRSRAVFGALALLAFAALALSAPRLIEHRVRQRLAQIDDLDATGIHVDLFWHIHIERLTASHPRGALTCHDLRLETALRPIVAPRARTPRLRHVDVPRCTVDLSLDANLAERDTPETSDAKPTASIQERLNQITDQLHRALRNTRTLTLHQLDLTVHRHDTALRASFHHAQWTQEAAAPHLQASVSVHEPLQAQSLVAHIRWENDHTVLRVDTATPVNFQDWTIDFDTLEIRDGEAIKLPRLQVFSRSDQHEIADVADISLVLRDVPNLWVERGVVHLPNLDIAHLLGKAHAARTSSPDPPLAQEDDASPSAQQTATADETRTQDVWSLRTLERARKGVRELQRFSAISTAQSPIYFDIRNLDLRHEQRTLMQIEKLQLQPDLPLTVDAQISKARVSLRADGDPPERWMLSVHNASLQRLAAFVELDEHLQGDADATLHLSIENDTLLLNGNLSVHHAVLQHEKVSELPIGPIDLDGEIHAKLSSDTEQEAELRADISVNRVPIAFELHALPQREFSQDIVEELVRFQARLALEKPTPCQDIWMAIPGGLLPDIGHASIQFQGMMKAALTLDYIGGRYHTFTLRSDGVPGGCSLRVLDAHWNPEALRRKDYIHHVQEGVTREDIYVGPGTDAYVAIDTLPAYIPALMYLSEEIAFYDNHAVSMGLINRGIRHSLPRRRFAYGGSTVTQQLVKNLYFSRTKKLVRKFQEAIIAWAMTDALEKDRILELYMNCIEFGPDLYGIERAALYYFGKSAQHLTPLEAAWLASLKPSPRRGERDFRRGYSDDNNWNSERIETLLRRLTQYTDTLSVDEVDALAPYVVYFAQSPNAGAHPPRLPPPTAVQKPTETLVEDTQ